MPPVALKSRLDVVFRATPSCVHHRGWGLCLSYLHHAAVQTTRASAYAALTSGSLQRSVCHKDYSVASIKPEQTIAETARGDSAARFITVTHDAAHLAKVTPNKSAGLILEALLFGACEKF